MNCPRHTKIQCRHDSGDINIRKSGRKVGVKVRAKVRAKAKTKAGAKKSKQEMPGCYFSGFAGATYSLSLFISLFLTAKKLMRWAMSVTIHVIGYER